MTPNYTILVNSEHKLPEGFEDTIALVRAENAVGEVYQVEQKTYEAFLRLRQDLLDNDGIQAELISAYRTVQTQEEIFQHYTKRFGLEYAQTYAAKPGHSEHHTGFAIDVGFLLDGKVDHAIASLLSVEHLFKIVHQKLHQYGFILRYPADKKEATKIGYEPWHFRYIDSAELAREMAERNLCMEEYF